MSPPAPVMVSGVPPGRHGGGGTKSNQPVERLATHANKRTPSSRFVRQVAADAVVAILNQFPAIPQGVKRSAERLDSATYQSDKSKLAEIVSGSISLRCVVIEGSR